ncbi:MAG: hypothetical protein ACE5IR_27795 [bacterium]
MQIIKSFLRLQSYQTGIVIILSFVTTYFCLRYDVTANLPTTLIGIAIVFPIVFSINAAYRRREEALKYFASVKAHCVALYYAHRDWVSQESEPHVDRIKKLINGLIAEVRTCLASGMNKKGNFHGVYRLFSEISGSIEKLRQAGVPANEVSRANQYLRTMMIDFERMRNISLYRTPTALRAYSQVFLNSFPVLFAPYFAHLSKQSFPVVGFIVAAFYSLVLVSLDNIQERLENPYDEFGVDDVKLNVIEEYEGVFTDKVQE